MHLARRELIAAGVGAAFLGPGLRAASASTSAATVDDSDWSETEAIDIGLRGRGWSDVGRRYSRLPARAEATVRKPVWQLAQESSGLCVDFETDTTDLRFAVDLLSAELDMYHMPATGVSGVDLYAKDEQGRWRWVFCAQPRQQNYAGVLRGLAPGSRQYRLYFPLYNGVESVRIGVPKGASFKPLPPDDTKPVAYYGTSITQGACASRPGMSFVNQLGRRTGLPMLNLGFSGNGRLELEVAEFLVELDPRVYVLDCIPNLGPAQVAERTVPFVERLRKARPDTPIVLVEDRVNANAPWLPARSAHHQGNHAAFRTAYESLVADGVQGLTYVPDAPFLGDDGEGTVDGSHPTDLGMARYADVLEPVLRRFL